MPASPLSTLWLASSEGKAVDVGCCALVRTSSSSCLLPPRPRPGEQRTRPGARQDCTGEPRPPVLRPALVPRPPRAAVRHLDHLESLRRRPACSAACRVLFARTSGSGSFDLQSGAPSASLVPWALRLGCAEEMGSRHFLGTHGARADERAPRACAAQSRMLTSHLVHSFLRLVEPPSPLSSSAQALALFASLQRLTSTVRALSSTRPPCRAPAERCCTSRLFTRSVRPIGLLPEAALLHLGPRSNSIQLPPDALHAPRSATSTTKHEC